MPMPLMLMHARNLGQTLNVVIHAVPRKHYRQLCLFLASETCHLRNLARGEDQPRF